MCACTGTEEQMATTMYCVYMYIYIHTHRYCLFKVRGCRDKTAGPWGFPCTIKGFERYIGTVRAYRGIRGYSMLTGMHGSGI